MVIYITQSYKGVSPYIEFKYKQVVEDKSWLFILCICIE